MSASQFFQCLSRDLRANCDSILNTEFHESPAITNNTLIAAAAASASKTESMIESDEVNAGMANLFSYSNLVHAISGATGSVIAISVFYPLDTVRTRLQVDDHRYSKNTWETLKDIIKEEGIFGLYLGWQSVASTTLVSSFVYFYTYACLQLSLNPSAPVTPTITTNPTSSGYNMALDLLIAFASGCINVLLTTPLWVANTRLKLQGAKLHTTYYNKKDGKDSAQTYNGMIDCLLKIARAEGVLKLWGGTAPSLILASNPAIQFMVYEALKRYFRKFFGTEELSGLLYFVLGAIAKSTATVITYPLQVIQSRLRAGFAKHESSLTLIQNLLHMVRTRGLGSLYKGMEAKLLQTVMTAALMFLIYEKIASVIFHTMGLSSKS